MADVKYLDTTGLAYFWEKIKAQLNQKQNTLTAGSNITITGNTISATDTTYDAATTTAAGLMSAADKVKLNGIAAGAEVNVQSDWNATSGDAFIKNKPTLLTLDDIGANNIYMTAGDDQSYRVSERLGLMNASINNKQDKLTFDTTPTANSMNPVTSYGVYTALSNKQDKLTFDTAPTVNSINPVTSGGIYTALSGKQNQITSSTNLTLNSLTASSFTLGIGTVTGITSGFTDGVSATALPTAAGVVSYVTGKNYATQTYVNEAIADLGDVLEYKGTVANYSNLPTNPSKGDVYNVTNAYGDYPAGTNFAWNGTAWDALGGAIDLSGYQLAEDLIAITTGEIDTILAS